MQLRLKFILLIRSGLMFTFGSLPYLALYLPKFFQHRAHIDPQLFDHWVDLYLLACPQNFIFNSTPIPELFKDIQVGFSAIQAYLYLTILYLFLRKYDEDFRANKHVQASLAGAVFLLIVSFIFTYIIPVRLVLDFNLIRNEQFARFFLTGFLVIYAFKIIPKVNLGRAFLIALMIGLLGIKDLFGALIILLTSSILSLRDQFEKPKESRSQIKIILSTSAILVNLSLTIFTLLEWELLKHRADRTIGVLVVLLISYFIILMKEKNKVSLRGGETDEAISKIASLTAFARNDTNKIRWLLILLPIVFMFYHFANFHLKYLERRKHPTGFWQLQNNWEDMQRYVKAHTPKDAMLLVPYNMEMGGFRIHSERKVLVCYRDCGIVGFDYLAALEWKKRISDIEAFKVFIEKPLSSAIVNAITKYKVDYMVFMKYAAPPDNQILKKLYQNEVFVLYKVGTN